MRQCITTANGLIEVDAEKGHLGFVLMCHAHPLHGGTMDHKVMTTFARSVRDAGFGYVRFNYRGVGNSEGSFGNIDGEITDAKEVRIWAEQHMGPCIATMGYSFGAYIAWSVRSSLPALLIAPAVHKMAYDIVPKTNDCMVILARNDEICPVSESYQWAIASDISVVWVEYAGHYFHRCLRSLAIASQEFIINSIIINP